MLRLSSFRIVLCCLSPWTWHEYSAAFCKLTFGRDFELLFVEALVDGDESSSNCWTCNISTYSSSPAVVVVVGLNPKI